MPRQRRRHGEALDSAPRLRADLGAGTAAARFGIHALAEPVRYRRFPAKSTASDKDDGKKAESAAPQTRQAKAAASAFKLSREVKGGPGTLLARLKGLRREKADDDLWSLLRSLDPEKADLAEPGQWW